MNDTAVLTTISNYRQHFKSEEDLVAHFKDESNFRELQETIEKHEIISISLNNQTIFIDSREIKNTLKYHPDYLLNARNWKRCLNLLKFSPNSIPIIHLPEDGSMSDEIKNYILHFIKDNYERMKRTCKDMSETKGGIVTVIEKTAELIKFLFGFQAQNDFKRFSNEYAHPIEIAELFNNLSSEYFASKDYVGVNFFDYGEIHFHLIFLMIAGSSKRIRDWCSDKECKRLQTFLDNRNTSSTCTGFEDIEDCKILAFDQS